MSYKSLFAEASTLTMRVHRHSKVSKGEKVAPDHEVNVLVYYGTEKNSYSGHIENRFVCEVPMSKAALRQLATDLWEIGIYPDQAVKHARRTKESLSLANAILNDDEAAA